MPHVHAPSKVTDVFVLQWCEMAIVIQSTSNNSWWGCNIWSDPKSYNRYYVQFCVPWILKLIPMINMQELLMAVSPASVDSPSV